MKRNRFREYRQCWLKYRSLGYDVLFAIYAKTAVLLPISTPAFLTPSVLIHPHFSIPRVLSAAGPTELHAMAVSSRSNRSGWLRRIIHPPSYMIATVTISVGGFLNG